MLRNSYITTEDVLKQFPSLEMNIRQYILSSTLHIPKEELIRDINERYVNKAEYNKYIKSIKLFQEGKPLAQILESIDFNGVKIEIDDNVLIPRPETEYISDKLANVLTKVLNNNIKLNILEVGTGSGAICVSIVKKLEKYSNFHILGIDISKKAVEITNNNIQNVLKDSKYSVLSKIEIKALDISSFGTTEVFNLIISNPPYIPSKMINKLSKSVKNYEPSISLDGGKDGLDVIREILKFAVKNRTQTIVLEINSKRQFNTIKKEFKGVFEGFKLLKDQYQRYRYIVIAKEVNNPIYPLL